jgi:membrane fusion protein (multidrug efflux system)
MTEKSDEMLKKEPLNPLPVKPVKKNHRALWALTAFFILAGLIWFLLWFFHFRFYQSTDDSYVNGNMVGVTSVISGSPIAFYADDTDLVKEGQLLVALDRTSYQVEYDRQLAALGATVLDVRQLFDSVKVNEANVKNKLTIFNKAKYDFDNRSQLVQSKAVSQEDFTHSKDTMDSAELDLKQAQYQYQVALDAAGNTTIEKHPLIEKQKASVVLAFYNLLHCNIYAPTTGYVAQRSVEVGQWVSPNTSTMSIIPIDYMWVDANFKETQLTDMRIGQPATVTIDMYGSGVVFKGKVLGIASGSGSVFSIIPPQNATGNWIKIVQRLAVRISMDPETMKKYPLRLGISADVQVDITNTDLPKLAQVPPTKPVATTSVFYLDMQEVEKRMEEIIQKNLANPS